MKIKKFKDLFEKEEITDDWKFWKIQPTSRKYMELALNKIGMPKKYPYDIILNIVDKLPSNPNDKIEYYDLPDNIKYGSGSWMFKNDRTIFVAHGADYRGWEYSIKEPKKFVNHGYKYQGEVRLSEEELDKINLELNQDKYNL